MTAGEGGRARRRVRVEGGADGGLVVAVGGGEDLVAPNERATTLQGDTGESKGKGGRGGRKEENRMCAGGRVGATTPQQWRGITERHS